jgi:hypothetical protein
MLPGFLSLGVVPMKQDIVFAARLVAVGVHILLLYPSFGRLQGPLARGRRPLRKGTAAFVDPGIQGFHLRPLLPWARGRSGWT